jgi:hypothetical protein
MMRNLKRILPGFAVAVLFVFVPLSAHAASATFFGPIVPTECNCTNQPNPNGGAPITTAPSYGCILATVQNGVNFMISLGIIAATFALVYAGFIWMTSGGNPEARNKGKDVLLNVLIGLVILLSAWLIVDFIMKTLYNPDITTSDGHKFGPWNSILQGEAKDQCIVAKKPTPISGGLGLGKGLTTELAGTGNQLAPVPGTGANCPAAEPGSMVTFPASATSGGTEKATPATVQNFIAMRAAALKNGIDLKVIDGYRSDAEQVTLWEQYHHDTSQVAKPCSLGGGGSNHNSGTAIDIAVGCNKTNSGCNTPTFLWLKAHAAEWNFRNALQNDVVHWSPSGR